MQTMGDSSRHGPSYRTDLRMFKSGEFSNAVIKCGNATWKVHRNILCTRSNYFAQAFGGNFKEAQDKVVTIEEDNPKTLGSVLEYLYSYTYTTDNDATAALTHARVWVAGDRYQLQDLKNHALVRYTKAVSMTQTSALKELIEDIYLNLHAFLPLRKALIETVFPMMASLLEDEEWADMMTSIRQLTLDLLTFSTQQAIKEEKKPLPRTIKQPAQNNDDEDDDEDDDGQDDGTYANGNNTYQMQSTGRSAYRGVGRQLGSN